MTEELFREDAYLKSCDAQVVAVSDAGIELDRTVCYPSAGGQPGDIAILHTSAGDVAITDTLKGDGPGVILHVPADGSPLPGVGDKVNVELDWDRRHQHMRMHTALHLLCALVDGQITGAQVGTDKSRIDFNIPESPDKELLESGLNKLIAEDHPVLQSWISDAELDAQPDLVRSMSVQPPRGSGRIRIIDIVDIDLQPCGGTHVKSTGEIGALRIGKIENKGKQNRRINIVFDA
ncbi:alanyl-tRNA editing protein [Magnetovibrio blakemorei]|uniref:Alanine--tRNA ligase n=1 Tax=Magnetovibrio blakemorei TaxID=28181 RepID=A0A1E5QAA9_9PROT|nr:alanyl-tRNA editing protein [Magnetovibrio blakemorei]OEJ68654.1 Ala-tRNA(Pro) hydrolase [Magnetovibrio blakemorei]